VWEDILKLRSYRLGEGESSKVNGREFFDAILDIRNDLRRLCNKLGLGFKENNPNIYYSELDSDYYRMLFHLNTIFYNNMSRELESGNFERSDKRLKYKGGKKSGKIYFDRRANVFIDDDVKAITITLESRKRGPIESPDFKNVSVYFLRLSVFMPKKISLDRLEDIKQEFIKYFTDNFDNGNLDVEMLVDNIFNYLYLEIDTEAEGTVREKWWQ